MTRSQLGVSSANPGIPVLGNAPDRPIEQRNATEHNGASMEIVYYTVAAIALYVISDWILQRAEIAAGRRFEYRTLIFFAIILILSVATFTVIQRLTS